MNSVWPSIILRCAQLSFAALIVASFASTVRFTRTPELEVPATSAAAPEPPARLDPLESFRSIEQRNLFRPDGSPLALSGALPHSALDLELVGTVVADPSGTRVRSVALVKAGRDEVVAVSEGEPFDGGRIRLVSVQPRRIVIDNGGMLETVALATDEKQQQPTQTAQQPRRRLGAAEIEARARSSSVSAAATSDASVLESLRAAARLKGEPTVP